VYEVKVSRNDFAKELGKPLKRREAESYANECYFAMPVGLIQADELPEGWGLIEATAGGLRVKKRAMQRQAESLPLSFVAAMARRVSDPPSVLPDLFWKYLGQELTLEQLVQAAKQNIETLELEIRLRAEREFRASEDYKISMGIQGVLRRRLDYELSTNPAKLDEWFTQQKGIVLDQRTRNLLASVRNEIAEILGYE